MFTVSEMKHGAIHFVKHESTNSGIRPERYMPGSTAYQSDNTFGQFFYQHIERREYGIWKSIYAAHEDLTIRVQDESPWLGFRLMLKKHIRHTVAGRTVPLMQGQVNFVYTPIINSEFRLKKGEVYEVFDMQVSRTLLKKLKIKEAQFDHFLERIGAGSPEWLVEKPAWSNAVVLDTIDYLTKDPAREAIAEEVVRQVIVALTRKKGEQRVISEQQLENLYTVREIIKKQFAEQMHLQEWAAKAHMNITYFKEMFKQVFELTPYHYLLYERIKAAKEIMVQEPDLSFAEVAQRCGFSTYNNLRRAFQVKENKTLTEWRNLPDFLALVFTWERLLDDVML
jgi:AraC-like DNA-binding protein